MISCAVGTGFVYVKQELKKIDELRIYESSLYTVKKGQQAGGVVSDLFADQINRYVLRYWLKKNKTLTAIKSGTYEIKKDMSLSEVLALLVSGKVKTYSIALIEGGRLVDFLRVIAANKDLVHRLSDQTTEAEVAKLLGLEGITNPEGLLMPDTYVFSYGDDDISIIKRAYEENKKYLASEYNKRAPNLPYKNEYEALIMASIIEKESAIAEERPQVASVFVNRLKLGMKLQTDPTVIYGVRDRYKGRILKSYLEDKNAYNTYVIDGLPITPIAMPSREAIHAALHPDDTQYLFFVAKGPDSREGHVFTTNVKQHEKAVQNYRKQVKDYKNNIQLEKNKQKALDDEKIQAPKNKTESAKDISRLSLGDKKENLRKEASENNSNAQNNSPLKKQKFVIKDPTSQEAKK